MENTVRKKRTKNASKIRPPSGNSKNVLPKQETHTEPVRKILDLPLDPGVARQAIILSEIIGKPVSKRGRRR